MAPARSFNRFALGAALLLIVFALVAGAALAQQRRQGWTLCNETSYVLEAATGRPDGRAIMVQGWVRLRPGECKLAVSAPLARGTHYLYARTSPAHRGGRRQWGGDANVCVDPNASFTIENPPQCAPMGLEERKFRRVNINRRESWRTSFAEAQPYTTARAQAAGLQRLLSDAGYETREGRSGVDPRQVAAAIAQFRASARLAPNTNTEGLIDALETAARRRSDQLGLTLCNRTHARIWTAIARRRGDGWESRGWWPIAAGGCARTIDDSLMQESYFISATMESDEGDRVLASGGEPFCVSPARFAILGRERCAERYYDTAYFTRISSTNRPGLVVEFSEREFLPPGEKPREVQVVNRDPDTLANDQVRPEIRRPPPPATAPDENAQRRTPRAAQGGERPANPTAPQ